MLVSHSELHRRHAPPELSTRGTTIAAQEVPERADALAAAIRAAGHPVVAPRDYGLEPIRKIHSADYIEFLRTAYDRWQQMRAGGLAASRIVQAHGFSLSRTPHHRAPTTFPATVPHYVGGGYAPIDAGTWDAAVSSAHCALEAAESILDGETLAYALCRPPGHHAYTDMAGGYCYLNNAAIAAQHLSEKLGRIAILDIDVHHGNGTQQIFYERDDVLTLSVHADPAAVYPFACGFAEETGTGAGAGYNLNLPLTRGSSDKEYLGAIAQACARVRTAKCSVLLVALGFDAYVDDPSAAMTVTTPGFEAAGAAIGALQLPTLLVQEGGYAVEALAQNLTAFLKGFGAARDS